MTEWQWGDDQSLQGFSTFWYAQLVINPCICWRNPVNWQTTHMEANMWVLLQSPLRSIHKVHNTRNWASVKIYNVNLFVASAINIPKQAARLQPNIVLNPVPSPLSLLMLSVESRAIHWKWIWKCQPLHYLTSLMLYFGWVRHEWGEEWHVHDSCSWDQTLGTGWMFCMNGVWPY